MYIGTRLEDAPIPRPHSNRPTSMVSTLGINTGTQEPTA